MRLQIGVVLASSLTVLTPAIVQAQTASESAAQSALLSTPVGGLPPTYSAWNPDDLTSKTGMVFRYGRFRHGVFGNTGVNTLGVTADLGDRWSDKTQLTLGLRSCAGCDETLMGGIDFYAEFTRTPMSDGANAPVFALGGQTAFGAARTLGQSQWYWAASLGMPVAIEAAIGRGLKVEPFVAPRIGWGLVTQTGQRSRSGFLPMIGSGVSLHNDEVGVHFGVERIIAERPTNQWGLGLSYRGPWR